ncbi:MAG: glycosyltransferase [Pseudomonadota bacterium]|mgnify:CR=1 FL=1
MKSAIDIAVVTGYFPNSKNPMRAIFIKNLVDRMNVVTIRKIISPLPWAPNWLVGDRWKELQGISHTARFGNLHAVYPRYWVIPKMEVFSGVMYGLSIIRHLYRLKQKYPELIVHVHCAFPDGVGLAWVAKLLGLPYVVTAHGSDINVYAQKKLLRGQIRWALRAASAVIGVSRPLVEKIKALTARDDGHVHEIPCAGYDPQVFAWRESTPLRNAFSLPINGRVLLFIGNLVPIKGLPILLEAWGELEKIGKLGEDDRLVIIGTGTQRELLEKLALLNNIQKKTLFAGTQAHIDIPKWLNVANALCLSSYNEGTPNVVVEALACGVPVIATRVGGVPALLEGTGLPLVAPGDAQALSVAIQRVLDAHWDVKTLQTAVRDYTWEKLASRNIQVLIEVAEKSCDRNVA